MWYIVKTETVTEKDVYGTIRSGNDLDAIKRTITEKENIVNVYVLDEEPGK